MTTIVTKNGSGAPLASDLVQGELAVDLTNKRLYTEDSGGTVIEVGTSPSTIDINAGTIDGTVIGGASAAAGTFTTFTSTGIDDNASSTAITIDSSENVGIGTASPSHPLHVRSTGTGTAFASNIVSRLESNGSGYSSTLQFSNNVDASATVGLVGSALGFGIGTTERMRIDSSGNVGIGTTSPSRNLDVVGAGAAAYIRMGTAGTTGETGLLFGDSVNNVEGAIIYTNSNNAMAFRGNNNQERMRIDSSGNVGIGTTSPTSKLEIQDTGSVGITIHSVDNATGNDAVLYFQRGTNETWGADLYQDFRIRNTVGALLFEYGSSGSTSEAMRIDPSGNLLVGRTSTGVSTSSFGFEVQSNGFVANSRNVTGANGVWQAYGNQGRAQVMGDGDLQNTNNSYGAISDERLKSNIVDASSQIDDIMAVQVRSYTLNETGATHIGVIAQELEASGMSGLVKTDAEGMKSVKYSILYMKAIKALQEAVTRIETLEAEVAALKGA